MRAPRAGCKYKGKWLIVSGKVRDVKKDLLDNLYIMVGTGKQFEMPAVQCFVPNQAAGAISQLNKGDQVTVLGKGEGLMGNVLLWQCWLHR